MKKKYDVTVPIAGHYTVCVLADDEDQAEDIAMDQMAYISCMFEKYDDPVLYIKRCELEAFSKMSDGNVRYYKIEVNETEEL